MLLSAQPKQLSAQPKQLSAHAVVDDTMLKIPVM
jgi:hypothetical protein